MGWASCSAFVVAITSHCTAAPRLVTVDPIPPLRFLGGEVAWLNACERRTLCFVFFCLFCFLISLFLFFFSFSCVFYFIFFVYIFFLLLFVFFHLVVVSERQRYWFQWSDGRQVKAPQEYDQVIRFSRPSRHHQGLSNEERGGIATKPVKPFVEQEIMLVMLVMMTVMIMMMMMMGRVLCVVGCFTFTIGGLGRASAPSHTFPPRLDDAAGASSEFSALLVCLERRFLPGRLVRCSEWATRGERYREQDVERALAIVS